MSKEEDDDDDRDGLVHVGDIPIDVGGGIIAAMLVTVIPPAVRYVASFL